MGGGGFSPAARTLHDQKTSGARQATAIAPVEMMSMYASVVA